MARRLYLGRLPADARQEDVQKLFDGYGTVVDCRVMSGKGFGFVEFETSRDAEDAVQAFNGKDFMGQPIVVEFAKEARRREPRDDDRGYGAPRPRRTNGFRIIVSGISRDTSWQDLKDFGREAGSVTFADIDRDTPGDGILEYVNREDADAAIKTLDNRDLRGNPVRVALADERSTYRRDDRPRDRYRGDNRDDRYPRETRHARDDRGHRYDSGYSDRYNDRYRDAPRSERSRSPRRDHDRRGGRTPPRREYEDKRMEVDDRRPDDRARFDRYDDRRGGREDDRPKRRDEDRYDDRRPVDGGEGGWAR